MDVKHWFGMVGMGVGAIVVACLLNKPTDLSNVPGARVPREIGAIAADVGSTSPAKVEVAEAAKAPAAVKVPAAKPSPRPSSAKAAESESSGPILTAPAAKPFAPGQKGPSVKGKIEFQGTAKNGLIDMGSDPFCKAQCAGKEVRKETTVVNPNGTLKNVVVYIKNAPKDGKPKTGSVILNQVGCTYIPHVLAIQIGQKVEIQSSDATPHNVHFKSRFNGDWNMMQSAIGVMASKEEIKRPEIGSAMFKCDIHPWMEARVAAFDHPFFAVTGDEGTFEIDGLPAGKYQISTWHEKEKEQTMEVTVADGATVEANFTFGKK